jgi:hypothetical protein
MLDRLRQIAEIVRGGSRKGSKGNAVRVRRTQCRGCPRNCKRRASGRYLPLGIPYSWEGGRRQRPASQEICHQQRSRASALGGVSWRIQSGCCTVLSTAKADRQSAKIAVTGTWFASGASRVSCPLSGLQMQSPPRAVSLNNTRHSLPDPEPRCRPDIGTTGAGSASSRNAPANTRIRAAPDPAWPG